MKFQPKLLLLLILKSYKNNNHNILRSNIILIFKKKKKENISRINLKLRNLRTYIICFQYNFIDNANISKLSIEFLHFYPIFQKYISIHTCAIFMSIYIYIFIKIHKYLYLLRLEI